MLWGKHKMEPVRFCFQKGSCFFRDMSGVIIQNYSDAPISGVFFINDFEKLDELSAPVSVTNQGINLTSIRQGRTALAAFIFVKLLF